MPNAIAVEESSSPVRSDCCRQSNNDRKEFASTRNGDPPWQRRCQRDSHWGNWYSLTLFQADWLRYSSEKDPETSRFPRTFPGRSDSRSADLQEYRAWRDHRSRPECYSWDRLRGKLSPAIVRSLRSR